MMVLNAFFESEDNLKKYGFEYKKDSEGHYSIVYDGNISDLMDMAFASSGFTQIPNPEDEGLSIAFDIDAEGRLINADSGKHIITRVDGVGEEPNFYIQFEVMGRIVEMRFSMIAPKLCLNDQHNPRLYLSCLSTINRFYEFNCIQLIQQWNDLRPDNPVTQTILPNYRAINHL